MSKDEIQESDPVLIELQARNKNPGIFGTVK